MELAALIATTMAVTQWLKVVLEKVNIKIEKTAAVVLTVVVALGVTVFKATETHTAIFSITTLWLAAQVIIGSIGSYNILKVVRPTPTP